MLWSNLANLGSKWIWNVLAINLFTNIFPWVFITMCWSRQYDFNLVHHPTPKNEFSYSEKKSPGGIRTQDPDHRMEKSENRCSKSLDDDPAYFSCLSLSVSYYCVCVCYITLKFFILLNDENWNWNAAYFGIRPSPRVEYFN